MCNPCRQILIYRNVSELFGRAPSLLNPTSNADCVVQAPGQPLDDTHLLLLSGAAGRIEEVRGLWMALATAGTNTPGARYRHSLLALSPSEFLLFGGTDGTRFFGDVWRLELHVENGSNPVRSPRAFVAMAQSSSREVGLQENGVRGEWTKLQSGGQPPAPRASHVAWISGGGMFVHGGWGADPTCAFLPTPLHTFIPCTDDKPMSVLLLNRGAL